MPTFEVRMRCTVTKLVTVEGCSEEEAIASPWDFAIDEREIEQIDWDVEHIDRVDDPELE